MSGRVDKLFDSGKRNILSVYFTAGFPERDDTMKVIEALDAAGVDMVEVGFPFSDPLADGPVIQESSRVALANGMSLELLFGQLGSLRERTEMPVVLMGYLNVVLQYGVARFVESCRRVGVDGVIIPDMPVEWYRANMEREAVAAGVKVVMLITPTTPDERIREIDSLSGGFLYMVSSNSITGGAKGLEQQEEYFSRVAAMKLRNSLITGFGISDRRSFELACRHSSGAIVGTAFIRMLGERGVSKESVAQFVNNIRS